MNTERREIFTQAQCHYLEPIIENIDNPLVDMGIVFEECAYEGFIDGMLYLISTGKITRQNIENAKQQALDREFDDIVSLLETF